MKTLQPLFYTSHEGAMYSKWNSGPINLDELQTGQDLLELNGVSFHSLIFWPDPKEEEFPRWDTVNGWTDPIKIL